MSYRKVYLMNGFYKILSYLLISSAVILSGCQSMPEPTNTSLDNHGNQHSAADSKNTAQNDWDTMVPIIKKYQGEIVFMNTKPYEQKIEVGVCFYRKIPADLKGDIEQKLATAIDKSVVVTPSSHLTLPIGGLDESVYQHDPCVY